MATQKTMSTRIHEAMASLIDKQEIGEYVRMAAEYVLKFKKTTDRKQLDATALGTWTTEVRQAVNEIGTAGIVLKHEMKGKVAGA